MAATLDMRLTPQALGQLDRYLHEIVRWRVRLNLTAARDHRQIVGLEFADALLALVECDFAAGCRVVDVGTGAGLPGIPLRIVRPDLKLTLVEASRRRVAFLEHARSALGLDDVAIEWTRAEEFCHRPDRRETFDRSVERAMARLAVVAELCLPLVRTGGAAVFLKGVRAVHEMGRAEPLITALGGQIVRSAVRTLAATGKERAIIVVCKVSPTPSRYPRGTAQQGRFSGK